MSVLEVVVFALEMIGTVVFSISEIGRASCRERV